MAELRNYVLTKQEIYSSVLSYCHNILTVVLFELFMTHCLVIVISTVNLSDSCSEQTSRLYSRSQRVKERAHATSPVYDSPQL